MIRDETSCYNGKRSYDIQKIKSFFDSEYTVIGVETGNKKMLVDKVMVDQQCVKSLIIEHKGSKTNVGSGLSDEQRLLLFAHPEFIIGKVITIQYFEESVDSKTNNYSLRFPTLKIVHGDKREV
jgi:ATP-dependent DNA ligase